jgi:phosphoesterase RecJ-like protein
MKYHRKMANDAKKIYREIISAIDNAETVLITSHMGPDGDSIGSQLAMARYAKERGKDVWVVNHGSIPEKYKFLPDVGSILNPNDCSQKQFDLIVILECPDLKRTGDVAKLVKEGAKQINIDHHPDNTGFGDIVLVDTKAAAVGEMLTEIFLSAGYNLDADVASLLYAAILTDTGRFRFESTTRRTMEIAGRLIDFGANPRQICDNIYFSYTESNLKLTGEAYSKVRLFENGKVCLISMDKKMLKGNGSALTDTEGMAEYTLYLRGVVVGALLREVEDDFTKISLRSRGDIDVSALAHKYGGGGHTNAAGCTMNMPLASAEKKLLEDLEKLAR